MNLDLTNDKLFSTMIRFSLPFLFAYFLQTLYGMADLLIIGQFEGVECITAVSIGSQVMHMVTVVIVGLSMGTTVLIGRFIGAGEPKSANKVIGNTVILFMVLSVVLAIIMIASNGGILRIMQIPTEAFSEAVNYLRICFIGIPFITAYNIISSIYRGKGDSRTPMYFVAISCVANILLDYFFIGVMGLKSSGAALGTTVSQTISVIIAIIVIAKGRGESAIEKADFKPDQVMMQDLLKIGIPVALQDGLIQVSFLVITVIVNRRGLDSAAAVGIVEKMICFIFLVPSTLLSTVSAMVAQNMGAGKTKRAHDSLKYAIVMGVVYGVVVGVVMQFAAEFFVGLFTRDAVVIKMGGQYMHSYVWDCTFASIHFCFSGYFCAMQKSIYSFIHNLISIVCVRIPLAWIFSVNFADTLFPLGFASTTGSLVSVIICLIFIFVMKRRSDGKACDFMDS